ncbi:UNVERIFIED_CONTAM: hypothetical protein FKN15_025728 [Acipenser sinensis]
MCPIAWMSRVRVQAIPLPTEDGSSQGVALNWLSVAREEGGLGRPGCPRLTAHQQPGRAPAGLPKSELPSDYEKHDPEQKQIYRFVRTLFSAAQLTAECAIVTLAISRLCDDKYKDLRKCAKKRSASADNLSVVRWSPAIIS